MMQHQTIEAPCNQQYDACFLPNKVLSDITPIHSPEVSPRTCEIKMEVKQIELAGKKAGGHHKYSASTNFNSPYSSNYDNNDFIDNNNNHFQFDTNNTYMKTTNNQQFSAIPNLHSSQTNRISSSANGNSPPSNFFSENANDENIQLGSGSKLDELENDKQPLDQKDTRKNQITESKLGLLQKIPINNTQSQAADLSLDNIQISEIEKKKVLQLRDEVKSRVQGNDDMLSQYKKFDNFTFLKFLRARDGSIKDSTNMFVDFLQWRLTNQVDAISDFEFSEYEKVQNVYLHGFHGVDYEGRPIWFENLGQLKLKELMLATNEERLKKYFIQNFERLINKIFPLCSLYANKPIHQYIIVLDMKDHKLSLSELKHFLNMTSSITKNNYPEILYKMYIINAGSFFSVVWKGVKYILNEKTRSKVDILGNTFIKTVNGKIKLDNLPSFVGGTCNHCKELEKQNKGNRVLENTISTFLSKQQ